MKNYTYNFEIKDLLTQFAAAFDDIVIKRYNNLRQAKEDISVRYVFGPKQRVMYDIINKAQNLTLPVIAINATSITRDASRVFNKHQGFYNYKNDTLLNTIKTPTPINITVSFSILARYMQDMDQILSNFIPFANPYIILSWKEPMGGTNETIEVRSEVLWDGNISLTTPTDMTYNDKFRVIADTTFTIKGWLFKDTNNPYPAIYSVELNTVDATRILSFDDFEENIIETGDYDTVREELSAVTISSKFGNIPTLTNLFYFASGTNLDTLYEFAGPAGPAELREGETTYQQTQSLINKNAPSTQLPVLESIASNQQLCDNNNYLLYESGLAGTSIVLLSSNNITITSPVSSSITTKFTSITSTLMGAASGFTMRPEFYNIINDSLMTVSIPCLSGSGLVDIIVGGPNGWVSSFSINSFHLNDVNANCYCC